LEKKFKIKDSKKSREVAKRWIHHVSQAISAGKNFKSFVGIPLILSMVAEIYKKTL
jgi:hypothetical protein